MNIPLCRLVLLSVALALGFLRAAGQTIPQPMTVPPRVVLMQDEANLRLKAALDRRYTALIVRRAAWVQRARDFNNTYVGRNFPEGSSEAIAGASEAAWLQRERTDYGQEVARFDIDVQGLAYDMPAARDEMVALARRLPNWTFDEVDRVRGVMFDMRRDGDRGATVIDMSNAWVAINARAGDPALAAAAAAGAGPALRGIGTQSFEDCTIFALAAATGRPYGLVAALAGEIIRGNTTRGRADRDDPTGMIKRVGMNVYEVILLTEALGMVDVVRSENFAVTVREGHAVMVDVAMVANDLRVAHHEVVLSRTFQHDGQTWFEVIDSNLGINARHYVTQGELLTLISEHGVAYRPEPNHTVPLLRP